MQLVAGKGRDLEVDRVLGAHVEQHAQEQLRAMRVVRRAKRPMQIRTTLQVDLRAVEREHASAAPALRSSRVLERVCRHLMNHAAQEPRGNLLSSLAERRSRDRLHRRHWKPVIARFAPQALEQELVSSRIRVSNHEEQHGGQQFWTERPSAGEIALVPTKLALVDSAECARNNCVNSATMDVSGTEIFRLECLRWNLP